MSRYRQDLETFTIDTLPDLDVVTLAALELFAEEPVPPLDLSSCMHPLVLGSGNAEVVGRILFEDHDALYADESTYPMVLRKARSDIEHAVVISASGSKHAVELTKAMKELGLSTWLYTTNKESDAGSILPEERVVVFPKNREPYTYNTSTYMGMLLSKTEEDPKSILDHLEEVVSKEIPENLDTYDAFYLLVPDEYIKIKDMFLTKFDELFGGRVSGRVHTFDQTKHGKTVVPSEKECFISIGVENTVFGSPEHRVSLSLGEHTGYGAMMAVGYYLIGHIQKQHPPYFKENIEGYAKDASKLFNTNITPIVE